MSDLFGPASIDVSRTLPALRAIESTFGAGVLSPAVHQALDSLGLGLGDDVGLVNVVTRSAPLGPASLDLVAATFYNLNPRMLEGVIPEVWSKASPATILATQQAAFGPVLAAALAPLGAEAVGELAELARAAAAAAATNREGRPLYAGLASLPWPAEDHLMIWHAAKLLREHRGDGHIALLVLEGLRGIDALVVHAAYEGWPPEALRDSRRWDPASWNASVADLRVRGWLTADEAPTLTREGHRRRRWIEDRTDRIAAVAYEPLGSEGVERMAELGGRMTAALADAGLATKLRRPPSRL